MRISARLSAVGGYPFDELDRLREARCAAGADVIDFGVGDPVEPTPDLVLEAAASGLQRHRCAGYPPYQGTPALRGAAAAYLLRRDGVRLDPTTQVASSVGSKEAVFHIPAAFVDPGDVVLVPSPGYPPYSAGTRFAEGRVATYAVQPDGPSLPDLDALDDEFASRLRLVWITQPHVPTGRFAGVDALRRLIAQCRERSVLLCSDEAYLDLWFDEAPPSALRVGIEGVLAVHSLSKRACMTGYRVGFVAGDAEAVDAYRRVKTQIDSGTPLFVQDAAVAALTDESAPAEARARFAARAEVLVPALRALGCDVEAPQAGFYLWVGAPRGLSGVAFARALLEEAPSLAVLPGEWLTQPVAGLPRQPGDGRVRLALVPTLERCREAAERLIRW